MYKPKNRNRQKMAARDSASPTLHWEIGHWRTVFAELLPALVQIWKKLGKERTQSKLLAISQHVMQSWCWTSRQGHDALEQKTVVWPWKRIRTKNSLPSKLDQGLNFTVIVDFRFCNDDFCKKKTWGQKNVIFLVFIWGLKGSFLCLFKFKKWCFAKVLTFLSLLDIPIWRTFYSVLTIDS